MCLKPRRAKCQRSTARGTFLNWRLNGGDKKCAFSTEIWQWPYLGNDER